jgi:hypothetical protein
MTAMFKEPIVVLPRNGESGGRHGCDRCDGTVLKYIPKLDASAIEAEHHAGEKKEQKAAARKRGKTESS